MLHSERNSSVPNSSVPLRKKHWERKEYSLGSCISCSPVPAMGTVRERLGTDGNGRNTAIKVRDGIDPHKLHRVLLGLEEYRDACADDMPGMRGSP